eukprot:6634236-Prymnesium_polylepis.1
MQPCAATRERTGEAGLREFGCHTDVTVAKPKGRSEHALALPCAALHRHPARVRVHGARAHTCITLLSSEMDAARSALCATAAAGGGGRRGDGIAFAAAAAAAAAGGRCADGDGRSLDGVSLCGVRRLPRRLVRDAGAAAPPPPLEPPAAT